MDVSNIIKEKKEKINRFNHSKIYKIVCDSPYYYIDGTSNSLPKRLSKHKQDAMKYPDRKIYKYFNGINWENVKIILIEELKLNNIDELRREEDIISRSHLNDPYCLNSRNAFNTEDDNIKLIRKRDYNRYWSNRDYELKRATDYYNNNHNVKINCCCGSVISKIQVKRHERTDKHKSFINKDINESTFN